MNRTIVTASAILLGAALAGCGNDTSAAPAAAGASGAATASASASSPTTSADATSAPKVGQVVDFTAVATRATDASKAAKTAHLVTSLGSTPLAQADVDYATQSVRETISVAGQSAEIIVVDKTVYLGGTLAKSFKATTPWVQVDPKGTDPVSKAMGSVLAGLSSSNTDPAQSLAAIGGLKATVTKTGADATTYKVSLTKAQVAQLVKASPGVTQAAGQAAGAVGDIAMTYTIDSKGLPREVDTTTAGKTVTLVFSKWGAPVTVTAPAASQVTPSSKLKLG